MKKINTVARYYETNEWAVATEDAFTIGITDFAQTVFGDIIFEELPKIGQTYEQGATFAITESNKTTSTISLPLSGEIIAINQSLATNPFWLNESPYDKGWLVKIKATNSTEWSELMTAAQYQAYIGVFFNKL